MAQVRIENVNKIYPSGVQAVFDFNLDIKDKEFIVFVGPSGCGKSTTLRMIAGLEDISSGKVYIDNKLVNYVQPKDRHIAMVFQSYALYPNMSVYDNLAFGLKVRKRKYPFLDKEGKQVYGIDKKRVRELTVEIKFAKFDLKHAQKKNETAEIERLTAKIANLGPELEKAKTEQVPLYKLRHMKKDEIHEKIMEVAKILQIEEYLARKPKALSGGQRQRVAIGRAIVRHPKLFLMDEPLSNLDAKLRLQMRQEIIRIHREIDATTIYVTHDQTEAMTMATRIVVMKDGYIQQIGEPREIYAHPANKFVASFIGTPAMNFVDGKLLGENIEVLGKQIKLSNVDNLKDYQNKEITIGIRPESITFKNDGMFACMVDQVELVGVDKLVHFNLGDIKMVAKVKNHVSIKPGDDLRLDFDSSKIHIFDKESGLTLL